MNPIDNQPIIFPELQPVRSFDGCSGAEEPAPCVRYDLSDRVYLQWRRGQSPESVVCPLMDPARIGNIVINPDFNSDASNWSLGSGWSWDAGTQAIIKSPGAGSTASQTGLPIAHTKAYRVTFTVLDRTAGSVAFAFGGSTFVFGTNRSSNGTFSEIITTNATSNGSIYFTIDTAFDGKIDSVDVQEQVTGSSCWTFDGWSYSQNELSHVPGETLPITFTPSAATLVEGLHYKIVIKYSNFNSGYLIIKNGSNVVGWLTNNLTDYYFVCGPDDDLTFTPTEDFDGVIQSIDVFKMDTFETGKVLLKHTELGIEFDLTPKIRYETEWATLEFGYQDADLSEVITVSCDWFISYAFTTADDPFYIWRNSNCIEFIEQSECFKLVKAYCYCEGFGFNFKTFRLAHRIKLAFTNPGYKYEDNNNIDSSGTHNRQFASRSKSWTMQTIEALDEVAHDCISLQLRCDVLEIDDEPMFCQDKDYSPEWEAKGRVRLAPSSFEVTKVEDVIYNRNAGCTASEFILRVLDKWEYEFGETVPSFRALDNYYPGDRWNNAWIVNMTKLMVNGVSLIETVQQYRIDKDGLGVATPALVYAYGVNFPGHLYVQNINEWVNSFLTNQPLKFYDDMIVYEAVKGTEFEIQLEVKLSLDSPATYLHIFNHARKDVLYNDTLQAEINYNA